MAEYSNAQDVEYEALPDNVPHVVHLAAGALAGISEHALMYPVDVIKVVSAQVFSLICLDSRSSFASLWWNFRPSAERLIF